MAIGPGNKSGHIAVIVVLWNNCKYVKEKETEK